MELVINFLLLAASGTAALFCWILSRKLKALTDAEAGIGAGIAALSQSAEEVKSAVAGTKLSADETAARIETLLEDANDKAAHLEALIDQLGDMSASVSQHADSATRKYLDTLAPFLDEANEAADRLLGAIAHASISDTHASKEGGQAASTQERQGESRALAEDDYAIIDEPRLSTKGRRRKTGAAA